MHCNDVASATTFLIFTCEVPFLIRYDNVPFSLAKCHLLGVFLLNKVFFKLCMCMSKASSPILEKIGNEGMHIESLHIEQY
jgi:hypothetical protein